MGSMNCLMICGDKQHINNIRVGDPPYTYVPHAISLRFTDVSSYLMDSHVSVVGVLNIMHVHVGIGLLNVWSLVVSSRS